MEETLTTYTVRYRQSEIAAFPTRTDAESFAATHPDYTVHTETLPATLPRLYQRTR